MRRNTDKVYIFNTIVITLCIQLAFTACTRTPDTPVKPQKPPVDDALARSEALFKQREDPAKLREAVETLAAARDPDNRNYEVEWRFAKDSCVLGQASTDDAEREKHFNAGKEAARIASRMQPDKPDGYFWLAANLGELSKMSPISVGLKNIDDIQNAANKVIEINPGYQGASAYDILAQVELNTHLIGGKADEAVGYLQKAIQIEKRNSTLHLDLARAYIAVNKYDLSKKELETVVTMQPDPEYLLEHNANVAEAKKMLATKF
jgi:tetratricopeptide (TPR) repeat protein